MSILLFCLGALAFAVGGAVIGFGIPINEFSFGNTLIIAGTTAAAGGLIVFALGAVVSKLQKLAASLDNAALDRPARPIERYEAGMPPAPKAAPKMAAKAAPGRVPFPPKPKVAAPAPQPAASMPPTPATVQRSEPPVTESFAAAFAPTLRNPDEPPAAIEEDAVSLSLTQAMAAALSGTSEAEKRSKEKPAPAPPVSEPPPHFEPPILPFPAPERQPGSDFDMMWPPPVRPRGTQADNETASDREALRPENAAAASPEQEADEPAGAPQPAVLKSGVVDGMAYTLYTDGSIEAEMPHGTLRFASINELREYLESSS